MPGRFFYRFCDALRHRARLRRWRPEAALGRRAEDLVHRYLQSQGWTVVERNWTSPDWRGEADLIAWDGDRLVFVEVKSRRTAEFASPERALDEAKKAALRLAARYFMRIWRVPPDRARVDAVSVVFEPFELRHVRDAWPLSGGDRLS